MMRRALFVGIEWKPTGPALIQTHKRRLGFKEALQQRRKILSQNAQPDDVDGLSMQNAESQASARLLRGPQMTEPVWAVYSELLRACFGIKQFIFDNMKDRVE